MNKVLSAILLLMVAMWSVSSYAGTSKSSGHVARQAYIKLDDWQLTPMGLDSMPAKNFRNALMSAGKDYGYPIYSTSNNQQPGNMVVNIQWSNDAWLTDDWESWSGYDNKTKFYIAGIFTKLRDEDANKIKLSPEDFKSHTIGYIECVNALTNYQKMIRHRSSLNLTGDVEDTFKLCGISRIQ